MPHDDARPPARSRATAFSLPLWQSSGVFRVATFAYAAALVVRNFRFYDHPVAGWIVVVVMGAWSAAMIAAFTRPRLRRWPLLAADFLVTAACLLASRPIIGPHQLGHGMATLVVTWMVCPVIGIAIVYGRVWGALAALAMGLADVSTRGLVSQATLTGTVVMVVAAVAVGHVARLAAEVQERLRQVSALEAATRERERLARAIHDNVLQVIALVQRRATELGGEATELARLAGEQEAVLRELISHAAAEADTVGVTDLRAELTGLASPDVSFAVPATAVWLPSGSATNLIAAIGAALDNVRVHAGAGARAWVLVEDEADAVTVSVRDDGVGMAPDRLAQAVASGRIGVAQSIQGRIRDIGGTVTITSVPGNGTEVELRVSRTAAPKRPFAR